MMFVTSKDLYPLAFGLLFLFSLRFALPFLFTTACKIIGWRLRRNTQQRKDILLARSTTEAKQRDKEAGSHPSIDDEWEKIDPGRHGLGQEKPASTSGREWRGIVGFFHPFWYEAPFVSSCMAANNTF